MLRPPLRASLLGGGGGILGEGSTSIEVISLTRCPGHVINHLV